MGRFTGKIAVITGASKGIGAGIAKRLAAEGASVVVNYASSRGRREPRSSMISCRPAARRVAIGGERVERGPM